MQIFYEFGIFVKLVYDQSQKFFIKGLTNYLKELLKGYIFEPSFDAEIGALVLVLPGYVFQLLGRQKGLIVTAPPGRVFAIFIKS